MKKVLLPLAAGFEELEAVTIIDLLRRANISVTVAGLDEGPVTGSRGTCILPDEVLNIDSAPDYDMIVLPGGQPGADNLDADTRIHDILNLMASRGRYIAAICAAPKVLAHAGLLANKEATSFPDALTDASGGEIKLTDKATVIDGNVITSRSPGTAMDFSLELIQLLVGDEIRQSVEQGLHR